MDRSGNIGGKFEDKSGPTAGVTTLFNHIESILNEELVQKVSAVYAFELTGAEPGVWLLDLQHDAGKMALAQKFVSTKFRLRLNFRRSKFAVIKVCQFFEETIRSFFSNSFLCKIIVSLCDTSKFG